MRAYSMDLQARARLDSDAGMKAADVAAKYRVSGSWGRCCMKPLASEVVWPALLLTRCSQWLQPPEGTRYMAD